jgi:HEAT repeat protein
VHLTYLAILGLALAAAPSARPSSPAPVGKAGKAGDERSQLAAYLKSHDVPSAVELGALAKMPGRPLMAIAADARAEVLVRARAVAALRFWPSAETRSFLGKLVQEQAEATDATNRLLVRRAAVALGWLGGAGVCEQLALLFDNEDSEVRVDGAIGLGLTRAPEAPAVLRKQLTVESVARVRDQIERQLRALNQQPLAPEQPPPRKERPPMRSSF